MKTVEQGLWTAVGAAVVVAALVAAGMGWATGPARGAEPGAVAPAADGPAVPVVVEKVPFVRPRPEWDRFLILVWQYQTSAPADLDLYRKAGFRAFHIDRGAGRADRVEFARREKMPYYVDHAADKGYLHLTPGTGVDTILRKRTLVPRPNSLVDPKTIETLRGHLARNVAVTKEGPVVAYAFDDEISLGCFNSPAEVDSSPLSVAAYRGWLRAVYGTVEKLNAAWGTSLKGFSDAQPVSFEDVRAAHTRPPFAKWNLSRWMDWRTYMDTQFADCLADLARYTNTLDAAAPAGFVGGQQPAPYGGYDYAKISRAVQWIEAYDIGGTCEILRSLWRYPERRPYVQTWFSAGDAKRDAWFLWYYLVHGNRGVIAWPDRDGSWFHWKGGGLAPFIEANADTIREVQGDVSRPILDPDTRFDADPVALFHSHPAVQASWVMDVVPHGGTWPNRSSSLDNGNQSVGHDRVAWMKMLEDCGYQYNVVTGDQVAAGDLVKEKYRVLVLGRAVCLSQAEAAAIRAFVEAGGTVIADCLTGLLDEHGVGRAAGGALDDLFGIARDESKGYLDGKTITEINGEKYNRPFLQRLAYDGALRHEGMVVYERGTQAAGGSGAAGRVEGADAVVVRPVGKGKAVYLNLTPVAYTDLAERTGPLGDRWRSLVGGLLSGAGLEPRARVLAGGKPVPMAETLLWRKGGKVVLCVVKNPPRQAAVDSAGEMGGVFGDPGDVEIVLAKPVTGIRNLRTGEALPDGSRLRTAWRPWEALVFEAAWPE
ncbi:MAG: beta-galactosidase trimerization domain-containing protein [Planctomycetes bacterium]|nr:beta-galactosidase trimerization domain-containing protein [Planctomycetota bacterium]